MISCTGRVAGAVAAFVALVALGDGDARAQAGPRRVSIEEAMQLGQREAAGVGTARAGVQRARAQVVAARSAWWPQIGASTTYVRTLASEYEGLFDAAPGEETLAIDLPFGLENVWRVGVGVQQQVFNGGFTSSSIELARAGVSQAELALRSARALAVLQVAQAYYDAALTTELVVIGEATVAQAEKTLELTRAGYEQGATPEFDLLRAEVTRDNERAALVQVRSQREIAFYQLKRLIGVPFEQPIELTSGLEDRGEGRELPDLARQVAGVPDDGARAPVAQARETVRARRAQLGRARSGHWPQIGLASDYGVVNYPTDVFPGTEDWRTNWTIGVTLAVPLFTGFRVSSEVDAAQADVTIAEIELVDTAKLARVDELQADADIAVAESTWRTSGHSVQQADRAYGIAQLRYEQGVSTFLELVDSQLLLARARINLARAARDLRVARVRRALLPALPLGTSSAAGVAQGALPVVPTPSSPMIRPRPTPNPSATPETGPRLP